MWMHLKKSRKLVYGGRNKKHVDEILAFDWRLCLTPEIREYHGARLAGSPCDSAKTGEDDRGSFQGGHPSHWNHEPTV